LDRDVSDRDASDRDGSDREPCRDAFRSRSEAPTKVLIIDEFCAGLHRRCAQAVAYNLRRLVTQRDLCAVVATADQSMAADLRPDTLICLGGHGTAATVEERVVRRDGFSLARRVHCEPGAIADYAAFARMHYRGRTALGFVDRIFVLRERAGGELLGVIVYGYGPPELALRNEATAGDFIRQPRRLNREMRMVRRLVIHPDVRGCGLGQLLVRRTLPRVGTAYVECLATMGHVNPVFEKAGMRRIGVCAPAPEIAAALMRLRNLGVEPAAHDLVEQICRAPVVRGLVLAAVSAWYRATSGRGDAGVARQTPQQLAQHFRGLLAAPPVYYLWRRADSERRGGETGATARRE
jgi:hypothetical protein